MAERLTRGTFETLAKSIWYVGQLGMKGALEKAPAPCRVEKTFRHLRSLLQLELDLVSHEITGLPEPIWMAATLASVESYGPDPEFDVYQYQTLTLDIAKRRKTYDTGIYLSDGDSTTITVYPGESGMAPAGTNEAGWGDTAADGAKRAFGQAEANQYLVELGKFASHIRQQH